MRTSFAVKNPDPVWVGILTNHLALEDAEDLVDVGHVRGLDGLSSGSNGSVDILRTAHEE